MSKAVLISIQPKRCELIASGKKTIEVRKTKPKIPTPFKCYIYCTKPKFKNDLGICLEDGKVVLVYKCNFDAAERYDMQILSGKVIGEFVCDTIITDRTFGHDPLFNAISCMNDAEIAAYCTKSEMYGWHISKLKIYDKPKELSEFYKPCEHIEEYEGEVYCDCLNCDYGEDSDYGVIACRRPITRPPQSWCYVERLVYEQ